MINVMWRPRFGKHANNDPEESADFRHRLILHHKALAPPAELVRMILRPCRIKADACKLFQVFSKDLEVPQGQRTGPALHRLDSRSLL